MEIDGPYIHIETGYGQRTSIKSREFNRYHYAAFFSALVGLIILVVYFITRPVEIHMCFAAVFYNLSIFLFILGIE
jgi:hypothetical protein